MNKKKITFWTAVILADLVLTIAVWEFVRDDLIALIPDNSVEYVRQDAEPTTVEGIVEARAYSWLKGPEALEYAKKQVTGELIEELSKR